MSHQYNIMDVRLLILFWCYVVHFCADHWEFLSMGTLGCSNYALFWENGVHQGWIGYQILISDTFIKGLFPVWTILTVHEDLYKRYYIVDRDPPPLTVATKYVYSGRFVWLREGWHWQLRLHKREGGGCPMKGLDSFIKNGFWRYFDKLGA